MNLNYVYVFDCVDCGTFYGEQSLTPSGDLQCPNCYTEQRIDSPYVEQLPVLYKPKPFIPERENA